MTNDTLGVRWVETSKLYKYADGVDPDDPASVPYEVLECTRDLTGDEAVMVMRLLDDLDDDAGQEGV